MKNLKNKKSIRPKFNEIDTTKGLISSKVIIRIIFKRSLAKKQFPYFKKNQTKFFDALISKYFRWLTIQIY